MFSLLDKLQVTEWWNHLEGEMKTSQEKWQWYILKYF
jgi:hypothetical protein